MGTSWDMGEELVNIVSYFLHLFKIVICILKILYFTISPLQEGGGEGAT